VSDTREALDWLAGVLQGDFHEDPSTSRSKSHEEVTESALKTGGDDIPWDKTLEYTRAKNEGKAAEAKRILEEIKKAMQQKDRN